MMMSPCHTTDAKGCGVVVDDVDAGMFHVGTVRTMEKESAATLRRSIHTLPSESPNTADAGDAGSGTPDAAVTVRNATHVSWPTAPPCVSDGRARHRYGAMLVVVETSQRGKVRNYGGVQRWASPCVYMWMDD